MKRRDFLKLTAAASFSAAASACSGASAASSAPASEVLPGSTPMASNAASSGVVLSHFKGHSMAGYGGAIKNISIGLASRET